MCKWFRGIQLDIHSHLNSRASFQLSFQHSHCSFRNYDIIAILHCHPPTQRWNFSSLSPRRRNVFVPGRNAFMGETPKRFCAGRAVYHAGGPLRRCGTQGVNLACGLVGVATRGCFPSFSDSGFQWRACVLVETFRRAWVRKRFPVSPVGGSGKRFRTQDTPKRF